jgi:hypothetical protein
MSGSYSARGSSRTPFIVTPYVADAAGELAAELPTCCPRWTAADSCRVSVHHLRRRKSGPLHLLTVATCATHGAAFTLYPPGFAPYLRRPVQRLSPDGREAVPAEETPGQWRGTLFEAAVDAEHGRAWPRSTDTVIGDTSWGSQCRQLEETAHLLGVAATIDDTSREVIAAVLSVGVLVLRELSRSRGYRAVGRAVCDVLRRLGQGARRAMQLLVCGHLAGRWGEPWRWDPERRVVERFAFRGGGTPPGR